MNPFDLGAGVPLFALKLTALGCALLGVGFAAFAALRDGRVNHFLTVHYTRLHEGLRAEIRAAAVQVSATQVLLGQCVLCAGLFALAVWAHSLYPCLIVPLVLLAPSFGLSALRRRRVARIEAKLDVFGVLLANALRASPSIGKAFAQIAESVPKPLDQEVAQLLREVHVGSTLEDALLQLSTRVGSFELDTMLSGLLIGRRVGGNVPEVLETAAATLREMHRLEGVLSAKTAEGRVQATLLAAMPVLVVLTFDSVRPGYFDVLGTTTLGLLTSAAALTMWLLSIVAARRILSVEL